MPSPANRPVRPVAAPDPGTVGDGNTPAAGKPIRGITDFLAPPQRADEIGRLGGYRVLGLLGQGGMGAVFRAEDPALGRHVALKVLLPHSASSPTARRRFVREARAQAAIEHDHVVTIHQVGEDRGIPFLAMPLLKGFSLAAALAGHPRPPLAETLRIGREIASGLAAAHALGLVHRDIKPGNVWLEAGNLRVKILDFGLACAASETDELLPAVADASEQLTRTGGIVGTPAYMSPEQAAGRPVDFRADLFSLGVVLYRMTTGKLPFPGSSKEAIRGILEDNPPPPAAVVTGVPAALNDLVVRLLAKNPEERPASAVAVADVLRSLEPATATSSVDLSPGPEPWAELTTETVVEPSSARPQRSRAAWPIWVALAAVVGLGGGTVLYLVSDSTPKPSTDTSRTAARTTPDRPPPTKMSLDGFDPDNPDWLRRFQAMKPREQKKLFVQEMQKRNPGFDGKVEETVSDDKVTGLKFRTVEVTDLGPVRAFKHLEVLEAGQYSIPGKVESLAALRGLPLRRLLLAGNMAARDYSPLAGMPLAAFEGVVGHRTDVLTSLAGLPLRRIWVNGWVAIDLAPLASRTDRLDLYVAAPQILNLSHLKHVHFGALEMPFTGLEDEPVLAELNVGHLGASGQADAAVVKCERWLRKNPHVERINAQPAACFWAYHDYQPKPVSAAWQVIGPLPPSVGDPFDPTGPTPTPLPDVKLADGQNFAWKTATVEDGYVNYAKALGAREDRHFASLTTTFTVPEAGTGQLFVGGNQEYDVFLNGKLVFRRTSIGRFGTERGMVRVDLVAGENRFFVRASMTTGHPESRVALHLHRFQPGEASPIK